MTAKKVLLTGAGGFVLSNFVRQTFHTKHKWNLVSVDRIRESHTMHNIYLNNAHKFYPCDISDPHFVDIIFEVEQPDVVVHGASEKNHLMINTNIQGTKIILDACKKWNVDKIIYLSTVGVYVHIPYNLADENHIVDPVTDFAATKAAAEMLIKTSGINYNILRLCENFGPWQNSDSIVHSVIKGIIHQEDSVVQTRELNAHDWCHVYDTCSAIIHLIKKDYKNEIYNVSAGYELYDVEFVQKICKILDKESHQVNFNNFSSPSDKRQVMSSEKLRNTGWEPSWKFIDGLEHTCQWYMNNKYWLKF